MKRKSLKRKKEKSRMMKGSLARDLTLQLGHVSLLSFQQQQQQQSSSFAPPNTSCFHKFLQLGDEVPDEETPSSLLVDADVDDKDFILSQDFFCTPDYITPDGQQIINSLDKENIPCPKSPEKLNSIRSKRQRQEAFSGNPVSSNFQSHEQVMELQSDLIATNEFTTEKPSFNGSQKKQNYVSQSAVTLRCQVMPPPCIKNPYLKDSAEMDSDPFGYQRSKSAVADGNGLSRYRTDFHEIEQIGYGNFSRVFKVLKRIDGCFYAVKHSVRQLHQETERRQALMEVQALAALGYHENIVGYYTSWFENEQLYIQMELCDQSLSNSKSSQLFAEGEVLEVMHQIAKALQFIHEQGIAHLDVKPDNIYVKNGVYKLGDFGCATLIDRSLPVEEGDARYMPQEMLNDKYDHLDKVDIFSLGAAIYELVKGSPLLESGPQFLNLREGKISLLPGHSIQFQNLLKVMVDPDPNRRPSAKELLENPIFDRVCRTSRIK